MERQRKEVVVAHFQEEAQDSRFLGEVQERCTRAEEVADIESKAQLVVDCYIVPSRLSPSPTLLSRLGVNLQRDP